MSQSSSVDVSVIQKLLLRAAAATASGAPIPCPAARFDRTTAADVDDTMRANAKEAMVSVPIDTPPHRPEAHDIELVGGQRLVVEHRSTGDIIRIVAGDGRMAMRIRVTPAGALLELEGVDLKIQTAGDLAIEADRLAFHGRSSVALTTGGDALLYAAGDMHSRARIQNIKADLGNVNVTANDDVSINGERVRVNCDEV